MPYRCRSNYMSSVSQSPLAPTPLPKRSAPAQVLGAARPTERGSSELRHRVSTNVD